MSFWGFIISSLPLPLLCISIQHDLCMKGRQDAGLTCVKCKVESNGVSLFFCIFVQ